MTSTRAPQHEANILAKAERAMIAIESLAKWRLIDAVDFPAISTRRDALAHLLTSLAGQDDGVKATRDCTVEEGAAWWVAVGIEHDRLAGIVQYAPGELPTHFDSSRETVVALLGATIHGIDNPPPADPFAGLNGEPF